MVQLIQIKEDTQSFINCLSAIQNIAKNNLWYEDYIQEAIKLQRLPATVVTSMYWQNIKTQNVKWRYQKFYETCSAYTYEDYKGVVLYIIDKEGTSLVSKCVGVPLEVVMSLQGLTFIELPEALEKCKSYFVESDVELEIREVIK